MRQSIHIIEPGTHTSIQDPGRPGHRASGIAQGGAVDSVSMRIANLLAGNPPDAACLECALTGPTVRFDHACWIALSGARSGALPQGTALRVRPRQTVTLGPLRDFAYAYLAISGGIDVPLVFGSRSTDTRVGMGGHEGRRLRAGDTLRLGETVTQRLHGARVHATWFLEDDEPVRVIRGMDAQQLDGDWTEAIYRVSSRSDRMGVRLEGAKVGHEVMADRESGIVLPGTIQLPPNGAPIVLLADAQTLGGYPQIGHVIEADLPRFAQKRPGSPVRFEWCSIERAHELLIRRERKLALMSYAMRGDSTSPRRAKHDGARR